VDTGTVREYGGYRYSDFLLTDSTRIITPQAIRNYKMGLPIQAEALQEGQEEGQEEQEGQEGQEEQHVVGDGGGVGDKGREAVSGARVAKVTRVSSVTRINIVAAEGGTASTPPLDRVGGDAVGADHAADGVVSKAALRKELSAAEGRLKAHVDSKMSLMDAKLDGVLQKLELLLTRP
jgi:hypothetical protein